MFNTIGKNISQYASELGENIGEQFEGVTEYIPEKGTLVPILYLSGAAGTLAYGTYALVNHLRDGRKTNSVSNIAKVSAPLLVGSGLVFLGVREFWGSSSQPAGRSPRAEAARKNGKKGGRGRASKGRGRPALKA